MSEEVGIDPKRMRAMLLGAKLRKKRQECGLSMDKVVELSAEDIAKTQLSDLENGKTAKPDAFVLVKLARLYGISPDELFALLER